MALKVSIIGTNGIPAKYGGFETLTDYLSKHLSKEFDITVYCSKTLKSKRLDKYNNSRLIYLPFKANGWQSMIYDAVSIIHSLATHDSLIILGFNGALVFPLKFLYKKKIVFNIGGIEWQKVRGTKLSSKFEVLVKKWFEKICIKCSDVIVVDNQVLYDYVLNNYNIKPVLAEYGGDHAIAVPVSEKYLPEYSFLEKKYDITVSRAQEDMNIHLVIDAYKNKPERNVVIVSNWEITEYGRNLKKNYQGKYSNIILLDAIYDLEVINMIRSNCEVYLHTHSLCGSAPSLIEAMFLKLPVICFDVATNHATTEEKSLYFKDVSSLQSILDSLDETTINRLGKDMYEIAERRYKWTRIADLYKNCINEQY